MFYHFYPMLGYFEKGTSSDATKTVVRSLRSYTSLTPNEPKLISTMRKIFVIRVTSFRLIGLVVLVLRRGRHGRLRSSCVVNDERSDRSYTSCAQNKLKLVHWMRQNISIPSAKFRFDCFDFGCPTRPSWSRDISDYERT